LKKIFILFFKHYKSIGSIALCIRVLFISVVSILKASLLRRVLRWIDYLISLDDRETCANKRLQWSGLLKRKDFTFFSFLSGEALSLLSFQSNQHVQILIFPTQLLFLLFIKQEHFILLCKRDQVLHVFIHHERRRDDLRVSVPVSLLLDNLHDLIADLLFVGSKRIVIKVIKKILESLDFFEVPDCLKNEPTNVDFHFVDLLNLAYLVLLIELRFVVLWLLYWVSLKTPFFHSFKLSLCWGIVKEINALCDPALTFLQCYFQLLIFSINQFKFQFKLLSELTAL
jgi:hypothetical protein